MRLFLALTLVLMSEVILCEKCYSKYHASIIKIPCTVESDYTDIKGIGLWRNYTYNEGKFPPPN